WATCRDRGHRPAVHAPTQIRSPGLSIPQHPALRCRVTSSTALGTGDVFGLGTEGASYSSTAHQWREQIADDRARAGLDLDRDGHAGREIDDVAVDLHTRAVQ